jgi:sugar phosphate isomerase/epimerase
MSCKREGAATVKFAMCNEFCEGWKIDDAFRLARDVGYDGVEVAPFTIASSVNDVAPRERDRIRQCAEGMGVEIIGLHWLLVSPEGLYMNHPDAGIRDRTVAYMQALAGFCADLGGDRMVIGSPKQRNVVDGLSYDQAWDLAKETFRRVLDVAAPRGVSLCIEPLTTHETDFITTVAEGVRMVREIDHPNFRVHLDVKAMCGEGKPLDEIIRGARGYVGHFHANDANRNGPGWGDTDYEPVVRALREIGYDDYASVEVFDFSFGAEKIARSSLDFLKTVFARKGA